MNHDGKSRDDLTREANLVRSKLLHTVEQIDRKRHDALDVRRQVRTHLKELSTAGGFLVVGIAAAAAFLVHRFTDAAPRRRRERWRLAQRLWGHPDRALRAERRPFFVEVSRSAALALATAVVTRFVRHALNG